MSDRPRLLFLHGIGPGDREDTWIATLDASLKSLGYPGLDGVEIIAPHYSHALKGWDERVPLPPVTVKTPDKDQARAKRREFERRTAALEYRLGVDSGGAAHLRDEIAGQARYLPGFGQARNYLENPPIRAQVLTTVLSRIPTSGSIVIVGHSLGSVIAADLLLRLPLGLRVAGMITIGSPLASAGFDVDALRNAMKDPPLHVEWWVNIRNAADVVASCRGLSSVFPWLLDLSIDTGPNPFTAHLAKTHLADSRVAAAIGWPLFGSHSTDVARIERGVDVPVNEVERIGLLALRYAYLVAPRLKGDVAARFAGALRQVQAIEIAKLMKWRRENDLPIPAAVASLGLDLSDAAAAAPVPPPAPHLELPEALVALSVLATENVLAPFEISVPRELWQAAMNDLTAEMGLGTKLGTQTFDAGEKARSVLNGPKRIPWLKWGAITAGAAALLIGTGGLAAAASPVLAGGALITSALASFGPGGMIGGLITAGSLVTVGGGGVAFGLATSQTSAEALGQFLERRLTLATLRKLRDDNQDPMLWPILVEAEIEIRRAFERMDEFSEDKAPGLLELKRKVEAIERALIYLDREIGLSRVSDAEPEQAIG